MKWGLALRYSPTITSALTRPRSDANRSSSRTASNSSASNSLTYLLGKMLKQLEIPSKNDDNKIPFSFALSGSTVGDSHRTDASHSIPSSQLHEVGIGASSCSFIIFSSSSTQSERVSIASSYFSFFASRCARAKPRYSLSSDHMSGSFPFGLSRIRSINLS